MPNILLHLYGRAEAAMLALT